MSISRFLKSKPVRWTATGLGAALLLAVVAVYAATTWTLTHTRDVTPPSMTSPAGVPWNRASIDCARPRGVRPG